ncbi:MAG: hypothetical protein Q4C25_01580 [Bacillota bacterium]|nr:hypothetical protein [Bacillota bacterium]
MNSSRVTSCVLGIDTSNYKTSVAVVSEDKRIIYDHREFLKVKQGEKGLRQSDALFQHVKALPALIEGALGACKGAEGEGELPADGTKPHDLKIAAVAYSSRPRPVEGSYMPVFLAGESFARTLAAAKDVPLFAFSHQEGHIEAVKAFSPLEHEKDVLVCHFSGGTCELLKTHVKDGTYHIEIIGGSKDISFGQVLDRAGVMMGLDFPAGESLDKLALSANGRTSHLTSVKVKDGRLNLSGLDTQIKRRLEAGMTAGEEADFIREIFEIMTKAMAEMIGQGSKNTGIKDIIMAGGVSSSLFIKENLTALLKADGIHAIFDTAGLSQDNAVGTALLGGKKIWG